MGIFRRKKRKSGFFTRYPSFADLCRPYYNKVHTYLRMPARIYLANRWCRKHPKGLAVIYGSLSVFLLTMTILPDFIRKPEKKDSLGLDSFSQMNRTFEQIHKKQAIDNIIREQVASLGKEGLVLATELDSLLRLETKTRSDSARIISIYNTLNSTFNFDTNHENRPKEN